MIAGAGLGAVIAAAPAGAQTGKWTPAMQEGGSWMDKPGTLHRIAFDCTTAEAAQAGLGFANNYIYTSGTGYGLKPGQLGVILIFRHMATPFAYTDGMWAKHGRKFAAMLKLQGDEAIRAAGSNPLYTIASDAPPPPPGMSFVNDMYIDKMTAMGVQFAVCGLATQAIAMQLAGKDGDRDAIYKELAANLIPNAHLMPSGIVAVGHVQEHGYPIAYVGPEPD